MLPGYPMPVSSGLSSFGVVSMASVPFLGTTSHAQPAWIQHSMCKQSRPHDGGCAMAAAWSVVQQTYTGVASL